MNSEEIRARIAELEAQAEARAGAGSDRQAWRGPEEGATSPGQESWPWDFLFDDPSPDPSGPGASDFSLDRWLAEGLRGLRSYLRGAGLDEDFWQHLHAAEREILLAWRCLIDARLRRWEERSKAGPPQPERRQSIDIDFE